MTSHSKEKISSDKILKNYIAFLSGSNAIEGITNINYQNAYLQKANKGYFGAFLESQNLAAEKKSITVADICIWQKLISAEQLDYGHAIPGQFVGVIKSCGKDNNISVEQQKQRLERFLSNLDQNLKNNPHPDLETLSRILADAFHGFISLNLFADGNNRVGRLLVNYVMGWYSLPILIFQKSERYDFFNAYQNVSLMKKFMANKLQKEKIFQKD